jgi:phosphoribosylanthranilate isomerase
LIPSWILVAGITTPQDARLAERVGADAISISLIDGDPRGVRIDTAAEIAGAVTIETVLELKDPSEEALRTAVLTVEPSLLLLHAPPSGDSPPPLPWFRSYRCQGRDVLRELKDLSTDRFLLEVSPPLLPGGAAWQRDRSLLREVGRVGAMVLAGVPSVDQLAEVVEKARPWGLALGACVEREPGWLDPGALDRAMTLLRGRRR